MNVVILGNGDEELEWAHWLLDQDDHRLDAAFPGFSEPGLESVPRAKDLEDLLARPGIVAAIVGGPIDLRGEYLRRCAAEGMAVICLHPTRRGFRAVLSGRAQPCRDGRRHRPRPSTAASPGCRGAARGFEYWRAWHLSRHSSRGRFRMRRCRPRFASCFLVWST